MFGRRQRLRMLAAHMLLVWLFALFTGVVHACLSDAGAASAPASAAHDRHGMGDAAHGHEAPATQPHAPPGTDNSACQKFCQDSAAGVPADRLSFDAGAPLVLALLPTPPMAAQAQDPGLRPALAGSGPPAGHIPIPIAFRRLTR